MKRWLVILLTLALLGAQITAPLALADEAVADAPTEAVEEESTQVVVEDDATLQEAEPDLTGAEIASESGSPVEEAESTGSAGLVIDVGEATDRKSVV